MEINVIIRKSRLSQPPHKAAEQIILQIPVNQECRILEIKILCSSFVLSGGDW